MAWSLSGSTITQSGTDTDLSGLAGIAGVETYQENHRTIYVIGGYNIVFTGTLTSDAALEGIVSESTVRESLTFANGSNVTINDFDDFGDVRIYGRNKWFSCRLTAKRIVWQGGCTFVMNGGWLDNSSNGPTYITGSYAVDANADVTLNNCRVGNTRNDRAFGNFRNSSTLLKITNAEIIAATYILIAPAQSIDGFISINADAAVGPSGASPAGFNDFSGLHAISDAKTLTLLWRSASSNTAIRIFGTQDGTDYTVRNNTLDTNSQNRGTTLIYARVAPVIKDITDSAVVGAKIWMRDQLDQGRANANGYDFSGEFTYIIETTADTDDYLTPVYLGGANIGSRNALYNTPQPYPDKRFPNDVATARVMSYGNSISQVQLNLRGLTPLYPEIAVLPDLSITEQNPATVAAYTEIDTAARLYDRAKLHLLDNYAGETETLIARSGNAIDLRALNLVIDATAAAAFAFDGTTITIKASTFTGNLTTTGTVTLQNGATVAGSIVDANGVLFAVSGLDPQSLGTTWTLGYITEADYQNRDQNAAPATWTGWTQISGTGNTAQVQLAQDTAYRLFHRAPGYDNTTEATVNTGEAFSTVLTPIADRDLQGALLWPQTAAHATQAAKFTYNAVDGLVDYDNQTGSTDYIPFLAGYRAFGDIVYSPALTFSLRFLPRVNATKDGFVLDPDATLTLRMSDASDASAILEADLAYTNGQKAYDRFIANANHLFLLYAQMSEVLSSSSVQQVASAVDQSTVLAKEATVATRASQTSVDAIPTNPLLAGDARLDNLDAAISTRLASDDYTAPDNATIAAIDTKVQTLENPDLSSLATAAQVGTPLQAGDYTAPANADIAAIKVKTDTLENGPSLAEIEASTVLAKEATVATRASQASVDAIPTDPVRATDARLDNLDAAVSSRLAPSGYTAPDNSGIAAIKAKTDNLPADPVGVSDLPDVSGLATTSQLTTVNEGVKKASLMIPHSEDL